MSRTDDSATRMTRRGFAAAAGGALAGCAGAPAAPEGDPSLTAGGKPVSGPPVEELEKALQKPILDLSGLDEPVIIDSLRILEKDGEQFVHIRSKDGAEGISLTNGRDYFYPLFNEVMVPYFLGKDARKLESELLWQLYRGGNYKMQGLIFWSVQAWVEFAILDMLGRIAGKSIADLAGPVVRDEIDFYVASGRRDTTPEEEVEYLQGLLEETGAKAVKFRLGGRMSRNEDALPGRTENLIRLARKTLGDGIDIHGDSNSSYDPEYAIPVGRVLEEVNAIYYEEPCPFDHLEDTKVVRDTLNIDVSGGEEEFSERRFRWMIANRAVDIVQPDLHYYGGMIRSSRVANMAAVAGMPTTVHISGGFGFVYMLHFAARTPDVGKYQEYKRGIERYADWFDPKLTIRDSRLVVPKGPGVGIADIQAVLRGAKQLV